MRRRRAALLVLAATLAAATPLRADPLPIADDVTAHVCVSATGTAALLKLGEALDRKHEISWRARVGASVLMGLAGAAKEARDRDRGGTHKESMKDLGSDVLGIAIGNFLTWEF